MEQLTIGQVARQAGVTVETVRYYEKQGLLMKPARSAAGYRLYPGDAVQRLQFVLRAKNLGFTLREIVELLNLRADPRVSCADIRRQATAKIADIDRRMRALAAMKAALSRLADECSTATPVNKCPILEALEKETTDGKPDR
jgi:MerR family copper efflux transcriptional regulator